MNKLGNRSAYLITKPLQYINATNISDSNIKDCYLVGLFSDAEKFYAEVKNNSEYWDKVTFFKERFAALKEIHRKKKDYSKLFVDSDMGLKTTYYLSKMFPVKIYTYEEGYGSYRQIRDMDVFFERLKVYIYKILGCRNWLGGSCFTKGIYLYYPIVFKRLIGDVKKDIYCFNKPFIEHVYTIKELDYLVNKIDAKVFMNKNVIIYLSSWNINAEIYDIIDKYPNYLKIIKPHPHIHVNSFQNFDIIIENIIPSEILLMRLVEICKDIVVIHESSSSMMYLIDRKIKEINIASQKSQSVYNRIIKIINE